MSEAFAPIGIDEYGNPKFGGGDARLWVKFSKRARKNHFRSEQEGRPVFEEVDYVQIQQPGERDQLVRPVREEDKLRFPKQWSAYQADAEQVPEGTPVQHLFPNDPQGANVAILKDLKILTVEQLAECTEHAIAKLGMDGRKHVARARAYLDKAANMGEVNRLTRELEDANARIKVLDDANKRMGDRLEELEARLDRAQYSPTLEPPAFQRQRGGRAPPKVFDPLPKPEPPAPDPYTE